MYFSFEVWLIYFQKKSTHFTDAIKTTLGSNLYAIERPNKPANKDKSSKAAETKDKPSKQQETKKLVSFPDRSQLLIFPSRRI